MTVYDEESGGAKKQVTEGSFLYHLYFQIIKINGIYKIILVKPGFCMALELRDRSVQIGRASCRERV